MKKEKTITKNITLLQDYFNSDEVVGMDIINSDESAAEEVADLYVEDTLMSNSMEILTSIEEIQEYKIKIFKNMSEMFKNKILSKVNNYYELNIMAKEMVEDTISNVWSIPIKILIPFAFFVYIAYRYNNLALTIINMAIVITCLKLAESNFGLFCKEDEDDNTVSRNFSIFHDTNKLIISSMLFGIAGGKFLTIQFNILLYLILTVFNFIYTKRISQKTLDLININNQVLNFVKEIIKKEK